MKELQNLIDFLKNKGLTDVKIPIDVWIGIIEYFADKQQNEQCAITDVDKQRDLLKAYEENNYLCNCDTCKEAMNGRIEKYLSTRNQLT